MPAAMELQKVDWRKVSTIALIFWCKVGRGIWGGGFLCLLFFYCKEFGLAVAAAGGCDEWLVIGFPTGGVTFCLDAKSNQKDQGCEMISAPAEKLFRSEERHVGKEC